MEQPAQESAEQVRARHGRERKELQDRITSKKKNATKKTRRGVNDECARMERELRERQAAELAALAGGEGEEAHEDGGDDDDDDDDEREDGGARKQADAAAAAEPDHAGLARLALDEPPPAPASPAARPRPRNRQRERLARRAAEAAAAAQRASDEASSMADHRAREGASLRAAFAAHGLVETPIAPDGHCLFSAVADQLGPADVAASAAAAADADAKEPPYRAVRRAAADYMLAHADDFAPFVDDDLHAYAARVRDTAEWGGQLELTALARRYGVEIRVVQDGRTDTIGEDEGRASGKTLWLAYYRHGYGLGEHYNSLRRKTEP